MKLSDEEKEIHCRDCNAYLWSMSIYDEVPELIACPMQKDPLGHCTGTLKKQEPQLTAPVGSRRQETR